jgi:DNA-binding CsgD family transcriptional regulator
VLSPDGHILHAEGPAKPATARRALQAATRVIERARARKWDQPKALEAWKGLVSARWSLVDRFEEGGRRYVLARENHPRVGGLSSLTDAECSVVAHIAHGCTTKETAYNLGISDATVRVLLMRAARRCSVKTRGALLDLWRSTHRASGH